MARVPSWAMPIKAITIEAVVDVAALEDYKGRFANGYTPEDVDKVCSAIRGATGVEFSVLWDYYDDDGFGGDSRFVVFSGGNLFECEGEERLYAFLAGEGRCPRRLKIVLGTEVAYQTDSNYNYAVKDELADDEDDGDGDGEDEGAEDGKEEAGHATR